MDKYCFKFVDKNKTYIGTVVSSAMVAATKHFEASCPEDKENYYVENELTTIEITKEKTTYYFVAKIVFVN